MPWAIVADPTACSDPISFERYLKQLIRYWTEKRPNHKVLGRDNLKTLRHRIRPDVDVYPPFSTRLGAALKQFQHLTDEQYERLAIIEHNDRVVISGGAGTGKTYLLVQCARRASAKNKRVLIITNSPILAAQLKLLAGDRAITVATIGQLDGSNAKYDVVFADEGQDLMTIETLSRISELVQDGLDYGIWRWFMDENNQAHVAATFEPDAYKYLTESLASGKPARVPLLRNVRNTREIISRVVTWTGADIGKAEWSGHGGVPDIVVVNDRPELLQKMVSKIEALTANDVTFDQIGIICSSEFDASILKALPDHIRKNLVPIDPSTVRAQLAGSNRLGIGSQLQRFGKARRTFGWLRRI